MDEFAHALSAFEQKEKSSKNDKPGLEGKTLKVRFDSVDTGFYPSQEAPYPINPRFRFTFNYNKKYN